MTLDEWLILRNLSETEFAERIGRSQASVNRYRHGLRLPDREAMIRIIETTGGAVTANDFYREVAS